MMRIVFCFLLALVLVQGQYDHVPDYGWDVETMLDKYVHEDDGYFSWDILGTYEFGDGPEPDVTVFVVNMTSQKWMDEEFSDRSVWWHWVGIGVPRVRVSDDQALVAITGSSNRNPDDPPTDEDDEVKALALICNQTKIIGAYMSQNPNQPIVFTNDPSQKSRSEDDIIAWSWRTYLDMPEGSRDQSVILRAPMTKAAKRTLDTIELVLKQEMDMDVTDFIVSGASKRGWTTWSLGATDRRVKAMVPMVFSLLNIDESVMRHYQALNGWSFAFAPYYNCNLTLEFHNPVTQEIWELEDVFRYRSRLTMPKFLISATGDEFFLNHDSHSWWDGMPKPMDFWMVANAEHTLAPHYLQIYQTLSAFVYMIMLDDGADMPSLEWERRENGTGGIIEVRTARENIESNDHSNEYEVTAFRAVTLENSTRRDYRLVAGYPDQQPQPILWRSRNQELREVIDDDYYHWLHYTENYADEWVGHLIQVMFDRYGFDYYLTSEVNVVPDTYPVDECYAEECYGELV